jgi:S-adenosylmethionine:tRNA ribosyltransferase-isomerase
VIATESIDYELFNYQLPAELIAQEPVEPRDASRLLVVERASGSLTDSTFARIGSYLRPGDLLVLNDTKVIPALLEARLPTGGAVSVLLLKEREPDVWECLVKPARKLLPGRTITIEGSPLVGRVEEYLEPGIRTIRFFGADDVRTALLNAGAPPLPPYIKKRDVALARYQTVYARREGSAAAPTAGLHFTGRLLAELSAAGIDIAYVTLHVGLDTFKPVTEENPEEHVIHREWMEIAPEEAEKINEAKREGRRVVAVGTTSVRALESAWVDGSVVPGTKETDLYIVPGYRFRVVDALVTNFHLPRTTLLLLVGAFCGQELLKRAYRHAIEERYRFYSFGDAMLIL